MRRHLSGYIASHLATNIVFEANGGIRPATSKDSFADKSQMPNSKTLSQIENFSIMGYFRTSYQSSHFSADRSFHSTSKTAISATNGE
jgi:hypothetical protein